MAGFLAGQKVTECCEQTRVDLAKVVFGVCNEQADCIGCEIADLN